LVAVYCLGAVFSGAHGVGQGYYVLETGGYEFTICKTQGQAVPRLTDRWKVQALLQREQAR